MSLSELDMEVEQYRKKLLDEHYAKKANGHAPVALTPPAPIRLDLGCGKNKKEGFLGVDCLSFPGVDVQCNLGVERWPWEASSVDEVHCSHTLEHIPNKEVEYELLAGQLVKVTKWPRAHFFNELWRVLKPDAKATVVVPHWASCRYWGDPTHDPHAVSEFTVPYLQKKWRASDAPHASMYECDFDCLQPAYSLHPELVHRSDAFRSLALQFGKEAAQDMIFTLICKKETGAPK